MLNGILKAPSICLLEYSDSFLTSRILILFNFSISTKFFDLMVFIEETIFPSFSHFLTPPFKYPRQLSNPTLESLVIASLSFP